VTAGDGHLAGTFREVMAGVCTPVAVVTTVSGGEPYGTTVSAFTSLSLTPPMVMVALDERSELLRRLSAGSPLGVNVLRSGQSTLARVFARKGRTSSPGSPGTSMRGLRAWAGVRAGSAARCPGSWSEATTSSSSPRCTGRSRAPASR
jgi:flavin reductase (DIM6/NTAB) family NADH-FMN oxidoreductase RutF